jgi:hypothetical protein
LCIRFYQTRETPVRIDLPSGAWVDVKDNIVPGDRFAVQDAVDIVIEDGKTYIHGAASGQWRAFMTRIVTGWSYSEQGVPIPSQNPEVLDLYPDKEEDADALEDALQARYDRIVRRRPTTPKPSAPTNGTSSA